MKLLLTCFKCHQETALLTYEENRMYKVSCPCGCEYTFEHSSMACAESYHLREVELRGEIDHNRELTAQLAALQAENAEKDREISRAEAERDEARQNCAVAEENHRKAIEERDAAVELLRRLPESCCGCKYAVDGEACQCSECDDADTENCTETCPWWGDPCGLCDDKDSWSFCGVQGEG